MSDQLQQEIRFCTTADEVAIAYAVVGQGPPYLWVPGWLSHLEVDWENPWSQKIIQFYARYFTVVRYDKRGTGLSDRGLKDYSVEGRIKDVEAVVEQMGLRRFALRGVSEGCPVAIAYAAQNPGLVSRLVLIGAFARGKDMGQERISQALISLIKAEWDLGSRTMVNLLAPDAPPEQQEWLVRLQKEAATAEDAAAMIEAVIRVDVSEYLSRISMPTLIIHGRKDQAIPFEMGRRLAGLIPTARLQPFDGGHTPTDEQTVIQISAAIRDFLKADDPVEEKVPGLGDQAKAPLIIMFTDIEGSTTFTERLGDSAALQVISVHNRIVKEALEAQGGTKIKHTGDGIMAALPTATAALRAAVDIQRALDEHNRSDAQEPLRVRIGLNAGEPEMEDSDIFGTAVQLAARICDYAKPSQILCSAVVHTLAAGKRIKFKALGEVELKGFGDPVQLFEVDWKSE